MSKRKFVEFRDLPRPSNANHPTQQQDRINNILDYSKTALSRALKIARGFERQKLGRRQKTATAEKQLDNVRRLKLEVFELKALDLVKTAEGHLYKSLLKVKSISACDELPEHVRKPLQQGKNNESVECLNVQARLFNSDVVQKATDIAVEAIRAALGVAKPEGGTKRRLRAKDYADGQLASKNRASSIKNEEASPDTTAMAEEDEWEGISSPTSQEGLGCHLEPFNETDLLNDGGDDFERYESRLAAPSDSSSSDVDPQSHHRDSIPPKLPPKQQHPDQILSLSPSPSLSLSRSSSPYLTPSPPSHLDGPPRPSKPLRPTITNSTTFLPSLLTTGYYSGSDSDAPSLRSDEDNDQWVQHAQPRKNRMGQQARRALWEKKYKDRANHLRSENGNEPQVKSGSKSVERDTGWDARKGAVGENEGHRRARGRRKDGQKGNDSRGSKTTGANMDPVSDARKNLGDGKPTTNGTNKKKADGPLHPSWEAARRAKEAKSVAKPMGKKVVF